MVFIVVGGDKLGSAFSNHAYHRVSERLSMTHEELMDVLRYELSINIGVETGTNREHHLFYSKYDGMCFVAVWDDSTHTLITVLPVDYHTNIAWYVSLDCQLQAKALILGETYAPTDVVMTCNPENERPSVFRVAGTIVDECGNYLKNINLGSFPAAEHNNDAAILIQDSNVRAELQHRIINKEVNIDNVASLSVRLGKKGDFAVFECRDMW